LSCLIWWPSRDPGRQRACALRVDERIILDAGPARAPDSAKPA
jgi:hypothetical protein